MPSGPLGEEREDSRGKASGVSELLSLAGEAVEAAWCGRATRPGSGPFPVREEVSGTEGRGAETAGTLSPSSGHGDLSPLRRSQLPLRMLLLPPQAPHPQPPLPGHGPPPERPLSPGGGPLPPLRPRRRGPGPRLGRHLLIAPTRSPTRTRHRWRRSRAARPRARRRLESPGRARAIAAPSAPASLPAPCGCRATACRTRTSSPSRAAPAARPSSAPATCRGTAPRTAPVPGRRTSHRFLPAPLPGRRGAGAARARLH